MVPTTGLEAPLWLTGVAPPGAHNKRHAGTAALLALSLGLGVTAQQVQDAMGSLKGLPHRIEIGQCGDHIHKSVFPPTTFPLFDFLNIF